MFLYPLAETNTAFAEALAAKKIAVAVVGCLSGVGKLRVAPPPAGAGISYNVVPPDPS